MFTFLMIVEVLISILLILVVLMQSSKGGGLAGTFGGGNVGMMFGVRRTADFLIKATQGLGIAFGVVALLINLVALPKSSEAGAESVIQSSAPTQGQTTPQLPPQQAPQIPPPATPGQ